MDHKANEYVPVEGIPNLKRSTYQSLDDLAEATVRLAKESVYGQHRMAETEAYGGEWGGNVTLTGALELCRIGWEDQLTETLEIVESMVSKVEKAHDVDTFEPSWDVQGSDVDMGRYLSGEPENMISYPLVRTSKAGRVITVCATVGARAEIGPEDMMRRGQIVTAFALIVARLGYACELWADSTATHGRFGKMLSVRTLVKGTNDALDPSRILYAYAHPSMLRAITFVLRSAIWPDVGGTISPHHDMPEGTIYMDYHNNYDMDAELRKMLRQAGLLREGS